MNGLLVFCPTTFPLQQELLKKLFPAEIQLDEDSEFDDWAESLVQAVSQHYKEDDSEGKERVEELQQELNAQYQEVEGLRETLDAAVSILATSLVGTSVCDLL